MWAVGVFLRHVCGVAWLFSNELCKIFFNCSDVKGGMSGKALEPNLQNQRRKKKSERIRDTYQVPSVNGDLKEYDSFPIKRGRNLSQTGHSRQMLNCLKLEVVNNHHHSQNCLIVSITCKDSLTCLSLNRLIRNPKKSRKK